MDPIVNYLEDAEKRLLNEMGELFSRMREKRDSTSLESVEDLYKLQPIEGVLYEPCVRIAGSALQGGHYCSEYKLPKDEYVIYKNEFSHQQQYGQQWGPQRLICLAVTNYGRCFITRENYKNESYGGYTCYSPANDSTIHVASHGQVPTNIKPIIKVEPLSYKMPSYLCEALVLGLKLGAASQGSALFGYQLWDSVPDHSLKIISDTTGSLKELNKGFYLLATKWRSHMKEFGAVDLGLMRRTNEELQGKHLTLEDELRVLKEKNAALERENTKLGDYKSAVLDFMFEHYDKNEVEPYDKGDISDKDVIKYFSDWHSKKVFMDSSTYDEVMKAKEMMNEFRIYQTLKGDAMLNGIENSGVSLKVRQSKKSLP